MVSRFEGTIKKIIKRDMLSGKTTFGLLTEELDVRRNCYGQVECIGIIPDWAEGIHIIVDGEWDSSQSVFYIKSANPSTSSNELSLALIKDAIKKLKNENPDFKVGNTLPKKLLELSGPDIISFLKEPDSLSKLTLNLNVDEWKIKALYDSLTQIDSSLLTQFVTQFGGTLMDCNHLMKKYGRDALKKIKAQPYQIGYSVGMDFYVMDAIGKSKHVDPLSQERVRAMIYTSVNKLIESTGATYCIQSALKKLVNVIARKSSYPEVNIPGPLIAVKLQKMRGLTIELVTNGVRIYRKDLYQQESDIAKHLLRIMKSKEILLSDDFLSSMIHKCETEFGIMYSSEQKCTFQALAHTGVKIITGGPGTGKTTIINGLIRTYCEAFPQHKVALAAPTGRAAQRMWDVTAIEAKTIHKLVDYLPYAHGELLAAHDGENPIDADLIIIDEMSMVDTNTFSFLLPAIKNGSLVLLLGDRNQLQSVGPGNILYDLMKSGCFEVYQLKAVYRQKGKNSIIENAYKILNGNMDFAMDETFMIQLYMSMQKCCFSPK